MTDFDGFVSDLARKQGGLPSFGKSRRGRDREVGGLFDLQHQLSKMEIKAEADPMEDFVIDPFTAGASGRPPKPKRKPRRRARETEPDGLEGLDEAIELGMAEAMIANLTETGVDSMDFLRGASDIDLPDLDLI